MSSEALGVRGPVKITLRFSRPGATRPAARRRRCECRWRPWRSGRSPTRSSGVHRPRRRRGRTPRTAPRDRVVNAGRFDCPFATTSNTSHRTPTVACTSPPDRQSGRGTGSPGDTARSGTGRTPPSDCCSRPTRNRTRSPNTLRCRSRRGSHKIRTGRCSRGNTAARPRRTASRRPSTSRPRPSVPTTSSSARRYRGIGASISVPKRSPRFAPVAVRRRIRLSAGPVVFR